MSSQAAFVPAAKAPLEIKSTSTPTPNDGEILIKNAAIGINPVDAYVARLAIFSISYPAIIGISVAGTVQESKNPRFKTGDRVIAYTPRYSTDDNKYGAYQEYTIPDSLSFEKACAYPVNVGVAAGALFSESALGLERPKDWRKAAAKDKTVLIWGGSSSVGGYAIQLALLAGYKVVTTASPHNHAYVNSLGPVTVYDHADPSAPAAIAAHAPFVGILDNAGLPASHNAILEVLKNIASPGEPSGKIYSLRPSMGANPAWPKEVEVQLVYYDFFAPNNSEFSEWLYGEGRLLESLLAEGRLIETPVEVVGGLEKLDGALDLMLKGVSAKKLVIKL